MLNNAVADKLMGHIICCLHWLLFAVFWWLVLCGRNDVGDIDYQVKLPQARLVLRLVTTFGGFTSPSGPTQPGHPSVGRFSEYWRWFPPLLGKKRRFLRSTGPLTRTAGILVSL